MGTEYSEIFDLALMSIKDYKINNLYSTSQEDFLEIMQGFLNRAIPGFTNCKKDLSDRNNITRTFNIILDDTEKGILADLIVIEWLNRETNDASQITAMLQNKQEAHRGSEAQNLNAKSSRQNQLVEMVGNKMTRYGLKNNNWGDWANGEL